MATAKKAYVPSVGELIDALYQARELRLKREKEVEELKATEKLARERIIEMLRQQGLASGRGKVATGSITVKKSVKLISPETWPLFWAWARKDKLGLYVHKRVAVDAVREQLDAGKAVPGVTLETFDDLSLTKAGK